jgi:hypothetical protein
LVFRLREFELQKPLVPLSQWLAPGTPRRLDSFSHDKRRAYRYLKIGSQDAFAFPDLLPQSIVRVDCSNSSVQRTRSGKLAPKALYLVNHSGGLTCSRLHRSGTGRIVLCSRQLPYAPVELQEGTEAIVLGVADLEIRPIRKTDEPSVPPRLGRYWTPKPLPRTSHSGNAGEFIREARQRSGFSFREASKRTRQVAKELGDSRYYCSVGSLSDYETWKHPPRYVHKLIAICAVYFAKVSELLEESGAGLDKGGKLPMPEKFLPGRTRGHRSSRETSQFLAKMEKRYAPLPLFLHRALPRLFGLANLSVRDVFWAGGNREPIDSTSAGALFLIVDRNEKLPRLALSAPAWAQPIFLLQHRDGGYVAGVCSLQKQTLVIRTCLAGSPQLRKLVNRVDAEVVGRVVGMIRTLKRQSFQGAKKS